MQAGNEKQTFPKKKGQEKKEKRRRVRAVGPARMARHLLYNNLLIDLALKEIITFFRTLSFSTWDHVRRNS
jgi:hypothetical protein